MRMNGIEKEELWDLLYKIHVCLPIFSGPIWKLLVSGKYKFKWVTNPDVLGWVIWETNAKAGLNPSILLGQMHVGEKGCGERHGRREVLWKEVILWCRAEPREWDSQGRLGGSVLDGLARSSGVLHYMNAVESAYLWDIAWLILGRSSLFFCGGRGDGGECIIALSIPSSSVEKLNRARVCQRARECAVFLWN